MDRIRWEILVLAAAILVGALVIASSMRANRYASTIGGGLLDTTTGELYMMGSPYEARLLDEKPKEKRKSLIKVTEPVK